MLNEGNQIHNFCDSILLLFRNWSVIKLRFRFRYGYVSGSATLAGVLQHFLIYWLSALCSTHGHLKLWKAQKFHNIETLGIICLFCVSVIYNKKVFLNLSSLTLDEISSVKCK